MLCKALKIKKKKNDNWKFGYNDVPYKVPLLKYGKGMLEKKIQGMQQNKYFLR